MILVQHTKGERKGTTIQKHRRVDMEKQFTYIDNSPPRVDSVQKKRDSEGYLTATKRFTNGPS